MADIKKKYSLEMILNNIKRINWRWVFLKKNFLIIALLKKRKSKRRFENVEKNLGSHEPLMMSVSVDF